MNKKFPIIFKEKWLHIVDEQINNISKNNDLERAQKWKNARNFMSDLAETKEKEFEFITQNDTSGDHTIILRIVCEIDQYLHNGHFEKIKESRHYETKKSDFLRDLNPIKNNAKKLLNQLQKLENTYPVLSNTPSFNNLILFEIIKKLKDEQYPDHLKNSLLNNLYNSMCGSTRDLMPFTDILSCYLDILEKDLKSAILDEPYKDIPRQKNKKDEIIKLEILFNKIAKEMESFHNQKDCLSCLEDIIRAISHDVSEVEEYNFCDNYKKQLQRNKKPK